MGAECPAGLATWVGVGASLQLRPGPRPLHLRSSLGTCGGLPPQSGGLPVPWPGWVHWEKKPEHKTPEGGSRSGDKAQVPASLSLSLPPSPSLGT